jgi:serine phosphatase RsbU (regulator of sigma subunit)
MLAAMERPGRRKGVWILGLLALAVAAAYSLRVSPDVNAPLGLDRFDESTVREKVLATSTRLLETSGPLDVRLTQNSDTDNLRRMQVLFGFRATSYWTSKEVPIQRWGYRVYAREPLGSLNPLQPRPPLLEAEVSSGGQILALSIPPKKTLAPQRLEPGEALEAAQRLLRVLGVDVGQLTLTSTRTGEEEGRQTFDFGWKQPVRGLPGLSYHYSVQLQSGFLTSFEKSPLLAEEEQPDLMRNLVAPLLSGGVWFFLALAALFFLIQKLRRDEVDLRHAQKVALIAGTLTFLRFVSSPSGGLVETLLGAALVSLLSALLFGLLWAVVESFLRQSFGEKLRCADLLLDGHLGVRDTARDLLWASSLGMLLLAIPCLIHAAALALESPSITLMPVNLNFSNLRFPGGLVGNALLGPLPSAFLLATAFLGVIYPLVRSRLSALQAGAVFSVLFALAIEPILPYGPPPVGYAAAFLTGLAFFLGMEWSGIVAALAVLYLPAAFSNVTLLLTAHAPTVLIQGWLGAGLLVAGAAGTAYVALFGKPAAGIRAYEPEYLVRMRERERFARELEIAKGLQERFLPKVRPAIPGFSVATACVPAMEVGGDYFDFLPLPGGQWLLLLGDISGKGVKAAFYMTMTKGLLHAITLSESGHLEILRRLNRLFRSQSEPGIFLTLIAVILDPATRGVRLVSAGHNPPLLVSSNEARVLTPRGLVLGLMPDETFLSSLKDVQMTLRPGEKLLLYTDGVTEAMNGDCEEYSLDRLQERVAGAGTLGAEDLVGLILDDVARFQGEARQADDLTVLVLECHEP